MYVKHNTTKMTEKPTTQPNHTDTQMQNLIAQWYRTAQTPDTSTIQRAYDGLVVAIEREVMSCYNVVTLSDNRVIDWVAEGVEPEDAAETAREWMEQNNRQ